MDFGDIIKGVFIVAASGVGGYIFYDVANQDDTRTAIIRDINRDGYQDVVLKDYSGKIRIYLGTPEGNCLPFSKVSQDNAKDLEFILKKRAKEFFTEMNSKNTEK